MHKALMNIQKELPIIGRDKTADVGKYKYDYATMEHLWETVKGVIHKNGFFITHSVNLVGGYEVNNGSPVVVPSMNMLVTVAEHTSGGRLESSVLIRGQDFAKVGAEITYYRRYNIMCIFNIVLTGLDQDAKIIYVDDDHRNEAGAEKVKRAMNWIRNAKTKKALEIGKSKVDALNNDAVVEAYMKKLKELS